MGDPHRRRRPALDRRCSGTLDGDTLVIETTNYSADTRYRGATEGLRLVERFTRVAPDTLEQEVTLNDPATWTQPWTVKLILKATEDAIFEYACHEGNYAMEGILGGARRGGEGRAVAVSAHRRPVVPRSATSPGGQPLSGSE